MRHSSAVFYPLLVDALADLDEDIRRNAIYALCTAMHAADLPCGPKVIKADEERYVYRIRAWRKARQ